MSKVPTLRVGAAGATVLGLGDAEPDLTWVVASDEPGWKQTSFEIELDGVGLGRVDDDRSTMIPWPGNELGSRERRRIRVRVWGTDGGASDWSNLVEIESGLLRPEDWSAAWVGPPPREDPGHPGPAHYIRRDFELGGAEVASARLYLSSAGLNQGWLNGSPVGDAVLEPGWTPYGKRLRYATYDVTSLLLPGANTIGIVLADGWWRGYLTWDMVRNFYGDRLGLLAQLEVSLDDGSVIAIVSDEHWKTSTGPVLEADLYNGESYDARLNLGSWANPAYDDSAWEQTQRFQPVVGQLMARHGPPVRRVDELEVAGVQTSPTGKCLLDFGQNLVGWVRFTVEGEAGTEITLRHAEVLDQGEIGVRPLRNAKATDTYTLRGGGPETWEPSFTFHGFRYVEVTGWPGEIDAESFRAVVVSSDLVETGSFECSHALLSQLHSNIRWGMRGNFVDVPTDCPQRDERLGWTGDLQVFAPTATFLYDVQGMLSDWLRDMTVELTEFGAPPLVVPNVIYNIATAGWADVATLLPTTLYERYGDFETLSRQYETMKKWVDLVALLAGEERLWLDGTQLGDWLDPSAPPEDPGAGQADRHLVANAYFARSSRAVADAARILGRPDDEQHYTQLADEVRTAWRNMYLETDARLSSDAVTAYAIGIEFGLFDFYEVPTAGQHIVRLAEENDYRISTGFLGTPLVLPALCAAGQHETAYRLLLETSCPSWLYPVTMGATTIWERWDSLLPDGSINPGEMTSFNHYAFGSVGDWIYQTIGGLAPATPGYRRLRIAPVPGGGISWAKASLVTPYGPAKCSWSVDDAGIVDLEVVVPPNADAEVHRPGLDDAPVVVSAGSHRWQYEVPSSEAKKWAVIKE
jgi:alpha-L-rhamnosidase